MDISDRLSPHDLVVLEGDLAFIRPDLQQLIYGLFEIEGVYSVLLEDNTVRINPYNVRDYEDNQLDPTVFDSVSRLIRSIWEMPTDESDCEFMSPEDRQAQREEWWPDLLGT
jgi:hypothetical protein